MNHLDSILKINSLPSNWRYILMFTLIALTGFDSFFTFNLGIYIIAFFIFLFALKKRQTIGKPGFIALCLIITIFILQQIKLHGQFSLVITQIIRYLTLFYCAVLLRPYFKTTYIRIMVFISAISLIFYTFSLIPFFREILISIGSSLPEFRNSDFLLKSTNPSVSLYIYTVSYYGFRNSGPFWEPGMFVVFLVLALGLNLLGNPTKLSSKSNITLIVSLITTFSTTGYICLAFLIVSYVYYKNRNISVKILGILIIPFLLIELSQLDFMAEKIQEDMEKADLSYSRFGALLYHLEKIELNPLLGYGINEWPYTSMDMILSEDGSVSPNGWSIIAVVWGIPLALIYFFLLFLGLKDVLGETKQIQTIIIFISVMLSVFSQDVTNRLFFYVIDFIGILHYISYKVIKPKKNI